MSTEKKKTSDAMTVAHLTLGRHRGTRRLWIEGRRLDRAGITPGDAFTISWSPFDGAVVITVGEGDRHVSARTRHGRRSPIIDIGCQEIESAFGRDTDRVKVTVKSRRITVEIHPDDRAARDRLARLLDKIAQKQPLAIGSVCHGGGLLDHAVATGLRTRQIATTLAFAIEADDATIEAAASNNPSWTDDTLMVHAKLEEVDLDDLPEVDLVIAGLPCTGASAHGKAKNGITAAEQHPDAGHLFVAFLALLKRCNPGAVVIENVEHYANTLSAAIIRKTLTLRGYALTEGVVDGNALGALEMRRRWCLVATPPRFQPALDRLAALRTREACLGDILEHVAHDDPCWRDASHMDAKAERDRAKGSNFSVHTSYPEDTRVRTMGGSYRRRQPTTPKIRHPVTPNKARLLTPGEHARAKTVPEIMIAGLSTTLAHQILGNGVIHTAWSSVGQAIADAMIAEAAGAGLDGTPA